jgi:hypothetical protein
MKVLSFPKRQVAVRDVADIIGRHYPVHVIDVGHQEEMEGWTMADLVEYFEDEERLLHQHQHQHQHQQEASQLVASQTQRSGRRRKAAEKCISQTSMQRPRVLNQISLEFSKHLSANSFCRPNLFAIWIGSTMRGLENHTRMLARLPASMRFTRVYSIIVSHLRQGVLPISILISVSLLFATQFLCGWHVFGNATSRKDFQTASGRLGGATAEEIEAALEAPEGSNLFGRIFGE